MVARESMRVKQTWCSWSLVMKRKPLEKAILVTLLFELDAVRDLLLQHFS